MVRSRKSRTFLNPAVSTKTTFVNEMLNKSRRNRATSMRLHKRRTFLNPAAPTNTKFRCEMERESKRFVESSVKWVDIKPTKPNNDTDSYTKDFVRSECADKRITNVFLSRYAKKGGRCLVLDGRRTRTTKRLLAAGVGSVVIPNNSPAIDFIKKYAEDKPNVEAMECSLHDVIKTTRERYDIIYMDTCGMFTTTAKYDLKESIRKCFHRNLLKDGGIFGVTITRRTNGAIVDARKVCDEWIKENSGLMNVFTHSYGSMTTMFYI